MASGDATVAAPTVWAMRTDKVFIAFEIEDAENVQVCFEEQKITFSCQRAEIQPDGKKSAKKKQYRNELDLYGKVDIKSCGYQEFGRSVKCLLPRKEAGEYWPRLTKEKQKIHWLKVDFARWRDEDDDETEDKIDEGMGRISCGSWKFFDFFFQNFDELQKGHYTEVRSRIEITLPSPGFKEFDMNKMLGQLNVGADGQPKDIEDFDDLDDADSDDEDIDINDD